MLKQVSADQGMNMLEGVLVAQAPSDIDDDALRRFQAGLLHRVHEVSPKGVLIDVARVRLLDSTSFAILTDAGRMAAMLGAKVIFVGFQPGVVSAIMDLDLDVSGLTTALNVEDGLELLRRARSAPPEPPESSELSESSEPSGPEADAEQTPAGAAAKEPGPAAKFKSSPPTGKGAATP